MTITATQCRITVSRPAGIHRPSTSSAARPTTSGAAAAQRTARAAGTGSARGRPRGACPVTIPVVVRAKATKATASSASSSSGNTGLDVAKPARTIVSSDRNRPNGGEPSTANEPSSSAPPVTGTAASSPLTPAASRVL